MSRVVVGGYVKASNRPCAFSHRMLGHSSVSFLRALLQLFVVVMATPCFSQAPKPRNSTQTAINSSSLLAEKIIFARPDPYLTTEIINTESGAGIAAATTPRRFGGGGDMRRRTIAVMNPDGSGITDLHVNGFSPVLSPEGTHIAFCAVKDTQYSEIYVANADGTGSKRVTTGNKGDTCGPAWSHDGKKIAYYSFTQTDPSRNAEIWLMDADGGNAKRVAEHASSPAWSPDDRQLAFTSSRDGKPQIYAMNADGSNPRRLTNDKAEDSSPAWAPDGAAIAFVSDREGEHRSLFLMAPDGSQQRRLVFSKKQDFCFPAWSLDGGTIAFTALNRVGPQFVAVGDERPRCETWNGEYQLFSFDREGHLRQLTDVKLMGMQPSYGRLAMAH